MRASEIEEENEGCVIQNQTIGITRERKGAVKKEVG